MFLELGLFGFQFRFEVPQFFPFRRGFGFVSVAPPAYATAGIRRRVAQAVVVLTEVVATVVTAADKAATVAGVARVPVVAIVAGVARVPIVAIVAGVADESLPDAVVDVLLPESVNSVHESIEIGVWFGAGVGKGLEFLEHLTETHVECFDHLRLVG